MGVESLSERVERAIPSPCNSASSSAPPPFPSPPAVERGPSKSRVALDAAAAWVSAKVNGREWKNEVGGKTVEGDEQKLG